MIVRGYVVLIGLLLFAWSNGVAQDEVSDEEFEVKTYSDDDHEDERVRNLNRGIFVTPTLGIGLVRRNSNSQEVSNQIRLGSILSASVTIGIGRKLKVGIIGDRSGYNYKTSDSLRNFVTNLSIYSSYIIKQQLNYDLYTSLSIGLPEMILMSEGYLFQNDSTFLISDNGKSIRLFLGRQERIQHGLSFISEVGIGVMQLPKFVRVHFSRLKKSQGELELSNNADPNSAPLKVGWQMFYVRVGISAKL